MKDRYLPESGNSGYRVAHYDLDLDYKLPGNNLTGRAELTARSTEKLAEFTLDLAGLAVSKVTVDGGAAGFALRGRKLRITPGKPIGADRRFTVVIAYSGRPRPVAGTWGEVGWDQLEDGVIVASQPNGAASWFPCDDHPSRKATFRIRVTTDSAYRVVSNGTLERRKRDGTRTAWTYAQPEPMATYLATVQIGRYEDIALATKPVPQRAAVAAKAKPQLARDFGRQRDMMTLFQDCFGPYPFAQYTVVLTEDRLEIPVEAQGLSVFGTNHADGKRSHERLVAHELAHQWFGNSLTIDGWQHIWLNEGFACYAEWLWSESSGGPSANRLATKHLRRIRDLPRDFVVADPTPRFMFDDRLYKRGALALHALRAETGDRAFFGLLRAWTKKYRHGSVNTDAFLGLVRHEAGKSAEKALTPWLVEKRLPGPPASWPPQ